LNYLEVAAESQVSSRWKLWRTGLKWHGSGIDGKAKNSIRLRPENCTFVIPQAHRIFIPIPVLPISK
jgi:hypothetical protein